MNSEQADTAIRALTSVAQQSPEMSFAAPWSVKIIRARFGIWSARVFNEHGSQIASVELYSDETTERHANLIAAAPDLLEALQAMLRTYPDGQSRVSFTDIDRAKAAVAKATGAPVAQLSPEAAE